MTTEAKKLPWDERVTMLSINPDAATREDVANMAAELVEIWQKRALSQHPSGAAEGMPEEPEIIKGGWGINACEMELAMWKEYSSKLRAYALSRLEKREELLMGMRVVVNSSVPSDELWITDAVTGKRLGSIVNLATAQQEEEK